MNKQCVNCPGAVDHSTDECPIRARFEAYMLGREHPVIGWIDDHWLRRGDDPSTYANDYVQGCWVIWQSRQGVPDGWSVYRDSTGSIYVGVASGRLPGVWLYRDGSAADRMLWAYFDEVLDAAPSAPAAQSVTDHSQRALIRLAMNLLSLRNHVPGSDVDLCVKALADLLDGKHSPAPEPSEAWREVAEIAQAEAPAVVNQQVTTSAVAPDALEQARRHLSNAIEDAEDGKTAAALPALREAAHYLAQVAAPAPKTSGMEAICGKYGNVLRPFFAMMEAELHANTGKGDRPGWLAMSPEQCLLEIYYHTAKLQKAVKNNDMKGVREYTADVANMSMMLADTCGWLDVVSSELAANEQKSMADLIRQHRIAVTPEHEGQWHADLYGSEAEPLARAEGATPEAAVAAVVALYLSLQEQQP